MKIKDIQLGVDYVMGPTGGRHPERYRAEVLAVGFEKTPMFSYRRVEKFEFRKVTEHSQRKQGTHVLIRLKDEKTGEPKSWLNRSYMTSLVDHPVAKETGKNPDGKKTVPALVMVIPSYVIGLWEPYAKQRVEIEEQNKKHQEERLLKDAAEAEVTAQAVKLLEELGVIEEAEDYRFAGLENLGRSTIELKNPELAKLALVLAGVQEARAILSDTRLPVGPQWMSQVKKALGIIKEED